MKNYVNILKFLKRRVAQPVVFSFAAALCFCIPAAASPLPREVDQWRAVSEYVTDLTTSENLGRWTSVSYSRTSPPAGVEVQLTEGPGPGGLFIPEGTVSADDGPIGFLSTYETLLVEGWGAVLEQGQVTGRALAVGLDKGRTVTFESKSLSREELLDFAKLVVIFLTQNDKSQ